MTESEFIELMTPLCIIASCIMVAVFLGAVLQQSYRMYPPTDEEIAENPALEVYRP